MTTASPPTRLAARRTKPSSFLNRSFWRASALAIIGEEQRARDLVERPFHQASPLGLLAEELDPETGHYLGDFPQAFSYPALIEVAGCVIVAERVREF